MSSSREGGESPDPERQTGAQLHDTPGSGQGVDDVPNKAESKSQVEVRVPRFCGHVNHPC